MKTLSLRGLPALIVLAVTLVVGATSGAVAGGLITSAQIKDDNVRSVDIKDGTVGLADLSATVRSGAVHALYKHVEQSALIAPGSQVSLEVPCPAGQVPISGSVDWSSTDADATASYLGAVSFTGRGLNTTGGPDSILVTVICGTIGP